MAEPEVKEEEGLEHETDARLLLSKDHLSWLFNLINRIPMNRADSWAKFCISCCRFLLPHELQANHQHDQQTGTQLAQRRFPLILVRFRDSGTGRGDCYLSVEALMKLQVPIGDVLSHLLPSHSQPQLVRVNEAANNLARCLYVHPQNSREELWRGAVHSGRCAYRHCERVFNNKDSHLRLFGITPQFCSISCKIRTCMALL